MPVKERVKFCGLTRIPEGIRVQIKITKDEYEGKTGTAAPPFGIFEKSKGFISVNLDEPVSKVKRINIYVGQVEVIK